jgi:hypothetical protein
VHVHLPLADVLGPFLHCARFRNVVMSVGTLLTSLVGAFPGLVMTRTVYSVGASVLLAEPSKDLREAHV